MSRIYFTDVRRTRVCVIIGAEIHLANGEEDGQNVQPQPFTGYCLITLCATNKKDATHGCIMDTTRDLS
jgi:hypothetical protein